MKKSSIRKRYEAVISNLHRKGRSHLAQAMNKPLCFVDWLRLDKRQRLIQTIIKASIAIDMASTELLECRFEVTEIPIEDYLRLVDVASLIPYISPDADHMLFGD